MMLKKNFNMWLLVWSIIGSITVMHYITPVPFPIFHAVYRRLYYIPIILAAINFGLKAGLFTSLIICFIYIPHIIENWGKIPLQKYDALFELLLYNIIAYITAFLVENKNKLFREKEKLMGKLQRAEKFSTIGEIASIITHEIKTPLASISGAIEIIRNEIKIPEHKKKFIEIIDKEIFRINYLISNTFSIFRESKINLCKISITDFIKDLKQVSFFLLKNKNISIRIINNSHIKYIYIDTELFREVFINIVTNSLNAIEDKGAIIIYIENHNNYLYFKI